MGRLRTRKTMVSAEWPWLAAVDEQFPTRSLHALPGANDFPPRVAVRIVGAGSMMTFSFTAAPCAVSWYPRTTVY